MNDSFLIDELREGMRTHTDQTEVPSGFTERARRTARRRSARRAVVAGPPLLAAAGVATVLASTAGSPVGAHSSSIAAGTPRVHDTAYIIRRVRAHLAGFGQSDVVETVETGGNGNPGTDVTATSWSYTDSQSGVEYTSSTMVSPSGTNIYDQFVVGTPADNNVNYQYTNLDPVQHLYAVSHNTGPQNAGATNLAADVQQIKKELDSGEATQDGTATVDGQLTIKLTFPAMQGWTTTLYVDAQTYVPVQSLSVSPIDAQNPSAGNDVTTETWRPATAADIANAQLAQVPGAYAQVSQAELEKANPAGR